ncbi:diguanylate cyclase [Echinimonas agarilytica]|uniref:diguanylate cyclase n=1 Tax=Echinimonas agarilytica TaxID=1215918 RepID=A0AA41W6B1_9GAMM|nr:diguanylate cyclase [Echinimonas agarilytica]MCM2679318.1 diguanylate cyclase [Echinimonas agarilytica]
MPRLLIVEDSSTVMRVLKHLASTRLPNVDTVFATSMAEAKQAFIQNPDFYAAIVDLNLPDAPDGEVVEFTLKQGVSTIVLTGNFNEQRRKSLVDSGVVDYVVKESRHAYHYALKLARRLKTNHRIKVMVVDDSKMSRNHIRNLLERHLYRVIEAQDGLEAIEQMGIHPDVRLVITDFEMPNMDGFKLVNEIRSKFDKRGLAIIGLSSVESGILSAQFIKHGANDFLNKPFYPEEFYCRISQNLEAIELIEEIEDAANRDYLTGLYNRRAFFERAEALISKAQKKQVPTSFCIIDLDNFKLINDEYGHACGDEVLKRFARLFDKHCEKFLYARIGGEEFAMVMVGLDNDKALTLVNGLRQALVAQAIEWDGKQFHVSFSGGVITDSEGSVDHLYNRADEMLYRAKEAGRNMVFGND